MKRLFSFLVSVLFLTSCQTSFSIQPMPENLLPSKPAFTPASPFDPTPILPTPTVVPGPTPAPTSTSFSVVLPSTQNNFYGIPYESPTWQIRPLDSDHPFNILVLGVDQTCTLTINTKTNLQDLTVTTDALVLGRHTWQITRTFQGTQQVDEIYVPDAYPPEYTGFAGSNGYGYAMNSFYDSCRSAVQGILAEMQ